MRLLLRALSTPRQCVCGGRRRACGSRVTRVQRRGSRLLTGRRCPRRRSSWLVLVLLEGTLSGETQFVLGKLVLRVRRVFRLSCVAVATNRSGWGTQLLVHVVMGPIWVWTRGRADEQRWGPCHWKAAGVMDTLRVKELEGDGRERKR